MEVNAWRTRHVVHHLVGDELRLALIPILEQAQKLRRERVRHHGEPLHFAVQDLKLRGRDELAIRRVGEVGVRVDLAGHQHRPVHGKAAVRADHGLAAHLHGGRPERAEQATQVQHEERFLAEPHLPLGEVAAIFKDDGIRLALDLDEDAQLGQQGAGDEERDLVGRGERRFRLAG